MGTPSPSKGSTAGLHIPLILLSIVSSIMGAWLIMLCINALQGINLHPIGIYVSKLSCNRHIKECSQCPACISRLWGGCSVKLAQFLMAALNVWPPFEGSSPTTFHKFHIALNVEGRTPVRLWAEHNKLRENHVRKRFKISDWMPLLLSRSAEVA